MLTGGHRVRENSAVEDEHTISTHQSFEQYKDKRGCSIFAYKEPLVAVWAQVSMQ